MPTWAGVDYFHPHARGFALQVKAESEEALAWLNGGT